MRAKTCKTIAATLPFADSFPPDPTPSPTQPPTFLPTVAQTEPLLGCPGVSIVSAFLFLGWAFLYTHFPF